jgi:TnpA family transposase
MPVEFLTSEQEKFYGRYGGEPSLEQLEKYFHLDDSDCQLIRGRRGSHNQLGLALQLCTVRFLGTFLSNPIDVPTVVINYLAKQLGIRKLSNLALYRNSETRWEHTALIRQHYGYQDFYSQPEHWRLVRWLYQRATMSAESPSLLFDLATARLVQRKILLPGVSILARLVASIRERSAHRLFQTLAQLSSQTQRKQLEELLVVKDGEHYSPLDRLRHPPNRVGALALVAALNRLVEVRALGIGTIDVSRIPPNRLKVLARSAGAARSQAIARMPESRRIATMLAFVYLLEFTAIDDVLDLFDLLISSILTKSKSDGEKERLRTLKDLDAAALRLAEASEILLDLSNKDVDVRSLVFEIVSAEQLTTAVTKVKELVRPPEDKYYDRMLSRWRHIRIFLPKLLNTINFKGSKAVKPMLEAWQFLRSIEGQKNPAMKDAPIAMVNKSWVKLVIGADGEIDRKAYTFCVLQSLRSALRRRDIFVQPSLRYCDPHAKLLQGAAWEAARTGVCRTLDLETTFNFELVGLRSQLDGAYRQTAFNLPTNAAVRIEQQNGQDTLIVTGLDKLPESASLKALKEQIASMLPRVDLPEVLLEINARTGFASEFTHLSQTNARIEDLHISTCAVLLAEACNIGLEPLVRLDVPALTRARLSWVKQNYIRQETLLRANAKLVDAQAGISLAQTWGGGEVASADGIRFTVPVRTLNAGPNSKYFGVGRGITYYNFTSDQFTGFHGIVIPGTLRDSLFLLAGLLEQQTSLQPQEIMTDTAGYSDVVFGLFWLLGYQFSPRLADIGEARYWRIDATADYGALNGIARNQVNTSLIANNWDDMLRVAGSLKLGTVSALDLVRSLQRGNSATTLSKAIRELGRIAKTLYLLPYLDDETYRRRILTQLNRGEGRHSLSRVVFYGQRGELRQKYREGQEDQLGALGLVVNIIVLWNTCYMDAAISQLQATGTEIKPEDLARLSPLGFKHINMLGRYSFALPESIQQGELRSFHKPSSEVAFE